jgi:Peptidase family M3
MSASTALPEGDSAAALHVLNDEYCALHTTKEDAFWAAYMGLAEDPKQAQQQFQEREVALKRWLQDPERLAAVKKTLAGVQEGKNEDRETLRAWARTLEAHCLEEPEARALSEEIVAKEGELALSRGGMNLGYHDPQATGSDAGGFVKASSVVLSNLISNSDDRQVRKAAWEGLRSIEQHVLREGNFLEIVKLRNRLGRSQGAEDFYDWTVKRAEGMSKREIFALLDDLEARTRDRARQALTDLQEKTGSAAVEAWDVRFLTQGDVSREQDPFFPFQHAVERWGRSFAALGISYRQARLVLDLVDRKGKYENGFMHGPEISWRKDGEHLPARIHFTANAIPGAVGSGHRATQTLFHEGGHAAHFSNIDQPAPCYGQEFAPTSVAFAETQSMFLDSLLNDADWQARYARTRDGGAMPWDLVERGVRSRQPFAAWGARSMLAICYAEKALYEMPEEDLTPENVLSMLREVEKRFLFMESPRPVLSVPHLLSGESSAYYHGYVLAEMGVYQTRAFFLKRDGHLVDNKNIGPAMREAYWKPGNSQTCTALIEGLTGAPLSADSFAEHLNKDTEAAVKIAKASFEAEKDIPQREGAVELDASIRVCHGNETIANLAPGGNFADFSAKFSAWIDSLVASRQAES